jgi:hypothetical protein
MRRRAPSPLLLEVDVFSDAESVIISGVTFIIKLLPSSEY